MAALLISTAIAPVAIAADEPEKPWTYVDAQNLRIINHAFAGETERTYARLPRYVKDSIPEGRELWDRQQCSSGIGVRFATNSTRIGCKYTLYWDTHMIHMADTGLKGTDLYILEGDSVWRHVNTNRPYVKKDENGNKTKLVESTYVSNLDGKMHEYVIYFPLYDGIEDFSVKVDSGAVITKGSPEVINANRRIVAYGTSILQGGCASRTGMAATNIIGRELNCEVVNLGFSGEGKQDTYIARAMATIPDVDVFLLDPVPNCTEMMCDTLTYDFINILRTMRPEVPIIMVEGPLYPYAKFDSFFGNYLPKKNAAFHKNYLRLKAENPDNLFYVDCENLYGGQEGTVDGVHATDIGFVAYAKKLEPVIMQALLLSGDVKAKLAAAKAAKQEPKKKKSKK